MAIERCTHGSDSTVAKGDKLKPNKNIKLSLLETGSLIVANSITTVALKLQSTGGAMFVLQCEE